MHKQYKKIENTLIKDLVFNFQVINNMYIQEAGRNTRRQTPRLPEIY